MKGRLGPAYSRWEYIRGFPRPKVAKYVMGDPNAIFEYSIELVTIEDGQISHNALEAARVAVNRLLSSKLGEGNYCFRICTYPHHVVRENKMLAFAGADRIQKGMRLAFGKPIGTAARVKRGKTILKVLVNEEGIEIAKRALRRGLDKLPTRCRMIINKLT
jgi:large subunit ribosomal protein L10e